MKVKRLIADGYDTSQMDNAGNTAILCAAENGHLRVVQYLSDMSPWHTVNNAGRTFLETIRDSPSPRREADVWANIVAAAKKV